MSYYRRFSVPPSRYTVQVEQVTPQINEEEITGPGIVQRIRDLLTKNGLNDWEKNFLNSINEYATVRNRITAGQYNSFKKIEDKFSDAAVAKRNDFANKFTDEMRDNMKIVAGVYRATKSPYHQKLVEQILSDDKFVPTEEQWNKFMGNKYAQGYVVNAKVAPKFNIGDTVVPSSLDKTETWKSAIIIDNVGILPRSHAAGGKRYSILPYGEMKPIEIEERQMKFSR